MDTIIDRSPVTVLSEKITLQNDMKTMCHLCKLYCVESEKLYTGEISHSHESGYLGDRIKV